jgi:hypothetical protein
MLRRGVWGEMKANANGHMNLVWSVVWQWGHTQATLGWTENAVDATDSLHREGSL